MTNGRTDILLSKLKNMKKENQDKRNLVQNEEEPAEEQHNTIQTINDKYRHLWAEKVTWQETEQSKTSKGKEPHETLSFCSRVTDLNAPILRFNISGADDIDPRNFWRLRDAVRGVQIFGGIGSGKSSGSGQTLALSFLRCGFGGIVLTGKMDEVTHWKKYAKQTGRMDDLIIFENGTSLSFNPLEYETIRTGTGKGETLNLINLIMSIYEMGQTFSGGGGSSSERFWDTALRRCISNVIDLLKLAGEEISIFNMRRILVSMLSGQEAKEYNKLQRTYANRNISQEEKIQIREQLNQWLSRNYCLRCLTNAFRKEKSEEDEELYQFTQDYFLLTYPKIAEKTRAIVEESFYGLVEPFMRGILKKHFTQGVSPELFPEETYEKGKIIVINFPVKEYLIAGVYAQAIYKKLWQEAIERREAKEGSLPVFMWIDEAQYFLNQHDARFQTTARSSKACTVLITQNISNYYTAIGGKHPRDEVNSLLGNLATKIFHTNNDHVTNNWAADTIGKTFRLHHSTNTSMENVNGSTTLGESLNYQIEPQQFTILKGGGEEYNCKVEAIVTVAGKQWSDGKNFIMTTFDQNFRI
jgi:hypothetical protein